MKLLNEMDTRELNGGTTYQCPFCHRVNGGYWKVYWHALSSGCFKRNGTLNWLWRASGWCFSTALTNELCRTLNTLGKVGKHAK